MTTYLADIEWTGEPWEFDRTEYLGHNGTVWFASDSGCSCPEPFEFHRFPEDYEEIRTMQEFYDSLRETDEARVVDQIETARRAVEDYLKRNRHEPA